MVYSQEKPEEITELLTIGGLQLGTPRAKQQWIDEFPSEIPLTEAKK